MVKCNFCGGQMPDGKGKMFVKNDGKVFYFCNSKCEKNWGMGRQGKHARWTEAYRKETGRSKEK